ncbi:MAG TPA: hypothetical protein VGC49_09135 [Solirubrobacterales bacterium]|jgi:hypothetical protein
MSKEKKRMRLAGTTAALAAAAMLLIAAFGASDAMADFGVAPGTFDGTVLDGSGEAFTQAGGHPFSGSTGFELNTEPNPAPGFENGLPISQGANLRNVKVEVPPGLVGNPLATPRCSLSSFSATPFSPCPDSAQVGTAIVGINLESSHFNLPGAIYNLTPSPGQPALFGFWAFIVPVLVTPTIRDNGDYGLDVHVDNVDETLSLTSTSLTFWGIPASPVHDPERGNLLFGMCGDGTPMPCHSGAPLVPFLTNPVDCAHGPFTTNIEVESWKGETDTDSFVSHDNGGEPTGVTHCERVPFQPTVSAKPTTGNAESPTGLDFELSIPDDGLLNPDGIAQAQVKKAVVRLPEGMSLNPSAGEGLGVCTPGQYAAEQADTAPGQGCPNSSKLGTVAVDTPLLQEQATGSIYLAQPDNPKTPQHGAENPFDSLISMYMVARVPKRGVVVRVAGKVEPDPRTGQIVTTFDDLPQLPFSHFRVHFREGARSPLVSPPGCGTFIATADLTPWSSTVPTPVSSDFLIEHGVGGGSCPSAGNPPFNPKLNAGTLNNDAGSYSPFFLRMSRSDEDQEITNFSADLPPGVSAKLAGIPKCSDAALAHAAAATGFDERESPSCPAASQIGRASVGYGVGSVLTHAPGKVYLAGPYHGTPISLATVAPAVVGPFDVGTVIVRSAMRVDPETAQVHVDSQGSDPIPHILKGVLLHLRDIRVYMDRPNFVLNPTSCDRMAVEAQITGSGGNFASSADDNPLTVSDPFQAASCASLPFKPKLSFRLKGGTERGDYQALTATLTARKGDANLARAIVTLPHSEFLAQNHIRTICTRVQFKADNCPAASIYGHARAVTPLLDEPLQGPVYLRSSSNPLPDLVAKLNGEFEVVLSGRIDAKDGGIRNSFRLIPDAPVRKFTLSMKGGEKSLLVNSRNLCSTTLRANVKLAAQNSKTRMFSPVVASSCKGKEGGGRR